MAIPSDAEIQAAAVELGLVGEGRRVPPHQRAKVAKAIMLARSDDAAAQTRTVTAKAVAEPIGDLFRELTAQGLPHETSGRILAAVAPLIWRATQESKELPQ